MKKKALLPILIILSVLTVLFTVSATAATVSSGKCGDNMTWSYDAESKTLTFDGTGDMWNYPVGNRIMWFAYPDGNEYYDAVLLSEYCEYDYELTEIRTQWIGPPYKCVVEEHGRPFEYIYVGDEQNGTMELVYTDRPYEIKCFETYYNGHYRKEWVVVYTDTPSQVKFFYNENDVQCLVLYDKYLYDINWFYYGNGNNAKCIAAPNAPWFYFDIDKVVLSESVTDICMGILGGYCFEVEEGNTSFYLDENGVLFSKDKKTLISYPAISENESFVIPDGVTRIEDRAFYGCINLKNITIPDSVTSIGSYAFSKTPVTIYCTRGSTAHTWAKNEMVCYVCTDENWQPEVLEYGTCGDNITWRVYDNLILEISGTGAMTNWSSSSSVPWYSYCSSINKVVITGGVTSIGDLAFSDCTNLTNIEISASVTSIGDYAFSSCDSLISVSFGENSQLTSIGDGTFLRCTDLISIEISDSVTSIGNEAFSSCDSLINISFGENSQLTSIGDYAFSSCDSLRSIEIPNSVTSIGSDAFSECDNLESIEIPNSVTSIGDFAFFNCTGLTSVSFAENSQLTSIGDLAFSDCTNLTNIEIPNSVTSIGYGAFYNCSSLTDVYYNGTEEQWGNISIGSGNNSLKNATIHYNYRNKSAMILSDKELTASFGTSENISVYHLDGVTPYKRSFKVISSNPNVVKPTRNGSEILLKFISSGQATVTAYATDGSGAAAICSVEVTGQQIISEDDRYLLERFALNQLVYSDYVQDNTTYDLIVGKVGSQIANRYKTMFYLDEKNTVKWNEFYKKCIDEYKVIKVPDNPKDGFYAAAFEAPYPRNDIIIAYRGSQGSNGFWGMFDLVDMFSDKKEIDWWGTNLPMVTGYLSSQFSQAVDFYDDVRKDKENEGKKITLTGHSLGGALASYVAIKRDVRCDNINGATGWIINKAVLENPEAYPIDYVGFDKVVNEHFNGHDDLSNNAVTRWSNLGYFNYSEYADTQNYNNKVTDYAIMDSGASMFMLAPILPIVPVTPVGEKLTKDYHTISSVINYSNDMFSITEKEKEYVVKDVIENGISYVGTSEDNTYIAPIKKSFSSLPSIPDNNQTVPKSLPVVVSSRYILAGAGNDNITLPEGGNDTLIGNAGDDILNGGAGNDTYVYGGSFGNDTIIDPSGNDKILFTDAALSDITVSGYVITCGENTILLSNEAKRTAPFTIVDKDKNTQVVEMPKASPMLFSLMSEEPVNTSKGIQVFGNAEIEIYDASEELIETIIINDETAESVEYKDYGMAVLAPSALSLTLPEGGYIIKIKSEEKVSVWTVSDADNPTVAKQTGISEADLSDGSVIVINTNEMVEEQLSVKIVNDSDEQSIYNEAPEPFTITADKTEIKLGEAVTMSVPELFADAVVWECSNGNVIITKNEDLSVSVTAHSIGEDTVRAYLPNDSLYSAEITVSITCDEAPEVSVTCGSAVYDGSETATDSVAFDVIIPEGYDKAVFESQSPYSKIEETNIFVVNSVGSHTINIYCENSETGATTASFTFEFNQDSEAPEIHGVMENAVYYTDRIIEVSDTSLDSVYINGEMCEGETFVISDIGSYEIKAKDKAGNETVLSFEIKAMPDNVKQADSETVSQIRSDFEEVKYSLEEEKMELIETKLSRLEEILYTVTEVTEFTVTHGEDGISVSFKAANVPEDATVFAASYGAAGEMLELQLLTLKDGEASATFSATNAVSFKYFVWSGNIAPIVTTAECKNG